MTTLLMIVGGLALIGWVSDKAQAPKGWDEFTARWQQPTGVTLPAPRPAPEQKPRIINPLEQTYAGEWTTLSAP
jgi:hypothetical protein